MAAALRFVIEGEGAYTAVDGERVLMHPGDLILTPSWTFHDHGNPGDSPVVWFPSAPARDALRGNKSLHPCHGVKIEYVQPNGASVTPTLGAFLQSLPAGFKGAQYRSTDSTVFCVSEGQGRSRIGERSFEWSARDIFVAPSWCPVSHQAMEDSILFSFSGRPAQKALGLWRGQVTVPAAPHQR